VVYNFLLQNIHVDAGVHPGFYWISAKDSLRVGKVAWAWSSPFTFIWSRNWEGKEVYVYAPPPPPPLHSRHALIKKNLNQGF